MIKTLSRLLKEGLIPKEAVVNYCQSGADNLIQIALANYDTFHKLPKGTATVD